MKKNLLPEIDKILGINESLQLEWLTSDLAGAPAMGFQAFEDEEDFWENCSITGDDFIPGSSGPGIVSCTCDCGVIGYQEGANEKCWDVIACETGYDLATIPGLGCDLDVKYWIKRKIPDGTTVGQAYNAVLFPDLYGDWAYQPY